MSNEFSIGPRRIGSEQPPFVIAEIGINHEGELAKAVRMVDDAKAAGCECVKFQTHVVDDEMVKNDVIPGNAKETIWTMMQRCALSAEDEASLKRYVEGKGMLFLSTPFSRAAADRLEKLGVAAYKIGSGECNNYPLIEHIAGFGKPVILSTGMNDIPAIAKAVAILRRKRVPYALLHCTSVYPTPYRLVRLGALEALRQAFPDAVIGLSDHTLTNHTCIAAVALGARVLERHFTSDKAWPGPDIEVSMDPADLADLVQGSRHVFEALGGAKTVLSEEQPTIAFAYASVVTTRPVAAGAALGRDNLWVKRPGTGEIMAEHYETLLGRRVARDLPKDHQLGWADLT